MAALDDVYEVRFVCRYGDQVGLNVRHYRVTTTAGVGATEAEVAFAMDFEFAPKFKILLASSAEYRGCLARKLRPIPPTEERSAIGGRGFGTVVGDPLPTQVCGIVTLRTGFAGPRYRGRMYIPFPSEAENQTNSTPSNSYVAALDSMGFSAAKLIACGTAPNNSTLSPVIWSRKFQTSTPVLTTLGRQKWATQRSRGNYGVINPIPI